MKKTEEELRAANARRQARWRAKHLWLARERVKAVRGKSRAQTMGLPEHIGVEHKVHLEQAEIPWDTRTFDPDPEDCRTPGQVQLQQKQQEGALRKAVEWMAPAKKVVVGAAEKQALSDLARLVKRKGVSVDTSGW